MRLALRALAPGLALVGLVACRPPLPRPAMEVVWHEPENEVAKGELTEIPVTPGTILRFGVRAPVRVAEVLHTSEGDAEVWRTLSPGPGDAALMRAGLFTTAIRAPSDVVSQLRVGEARDPEFGWFDVEEQALAWARTPLGTPFPDPAGTPRLEAHDFADVDAVLGEVKPSADPAALAVSREAIRAIVALRAVRTIEGLRGYPYAENEDATITPADKPREVDERTYVEAAPDKPVTVAASGPATLFVWVRAVRAPVDAVAEARVSENGRARGFVRAHVRHPGKAAADGAAAGDADVALLHRMTVHVPPGEHRYQVAVTGAPALVAARVSRAVVRLGDALSGTKNETRLLAKAERACGVPGLEPSCALALALAGKDATDAFAQASRASERARAVAERFASGAPSDRPAVLEGQAVTAAAPSLRALGELTAAGIDPLYDESWMRATLRETTWEAPDPKADRTWLAFLSPDLTAPACKNGASRAAPAQRPIGAEIVAAAAPPWRRVHAVRLLVVASCEDREPVKLEVDGEVLTAQPGAPRSLWHVAVRGETARIRRLDKGGGQVFLLSEDACAPRASLVRTPKGLGQPEDLAFPADATAPGVDVWVREGVKAASVVLEGKGAGEKLDVRVTPSGGVLAVDEQGTRWLRAVRLPLPGWAVRGVRASGGGDVAVAAIVRGLRTDQSTEREHAHAPDAAALTELSRRIRATKDGKERGQLLLARARLLATYGAMRAAVEDAEAAKRVAGVDEVAQVRAAVLPPEPKPFTLASAAYGIEQDFDPGAQRCKAGATGPRARLGALDASLRERPPGTSLDRATAAQVADAALAAPGDPRGPTAVVMALQGSRWKAVHDAEAPRVPRPSDAERNPILDPEGRLRPRIDAGDPFGASFVTVTAERPAKAAILDLAGVKVRMDVVCIARTESGKCPLEVRIGDAGKPLPLALDESGKGSLALPYVRGRGAFVAASIPPGSPDAFALVRIVLDKPFPGTTEIPNVGFVLDTPHLQYRHLVSPGHPARIKVTAPDVVRIDAKPEPGAGAAELVVTAPGVELALADDGEPVVVPVTKSGEVVVTSRKGPATVVLAQRAEASAFTPPADEPAEAAVVVPSAARVDLDQGAWRDRAAASPRPLSWLESRLGTLEITTGGAAGSIREGARDNRGFDAFALESLAYRRRIESIDLQTTVQGQARLRDGNPSFVGLLSLYEDLDVARLRITGTLVATTQEIEGQSARAIAPRGFVEYSWRARPDMYLLPRLGFDGWYSSLDKAPASTRQVDDDVYDPFRFKRGSFAFLQALFWYVPYFNDIFYVRARGTYDLTNGAFSHAAVRPGVFLIFHELELGTFLDASYYAQTSNARTSNGIDAEGGATIVVHLPVSPGNLELRPNVSGTLRDDGGWTAWAGLSMLASYRRGVRDYSSLELSYPEETSFGIPWRPDRRGP